MTENTIQGFKELQSGTILCNGKYTIEKKIGEGGFGITYKAVQTGLSRPVCIKEYFPAGKCIRNTQAKTIHLQGISEDMFEKYRQAFVKEAKTLASLKHPNIVEVIDVFDENNTSYMVMSFIEGQTLQNIVDRQGKLSYPEAVNYIAQVTSAVGYIHEKNILHRDIKPDNVMITTDFKAVLIDFGSAREFEHDKTQVHTSMVSHGYAPTEQYTANSRKGSYTDIYAIGATLYFTLTGKAPLEAAARMTEKMPEPKELNHEIPDEANRTILKAMQIKAENRHQSVQEFMEDLRNIKPSELVDESIGGATIIVKKSHKWLWWMLFAVLIFAGVGGVWFYQHNKAVKEQNIIDEAKHNMLDGKVDDLNVWIYEGTIYLCPTKGVLAQTSYYKIGNNSQLEMVSSLPQNLSLVCKYVYTGQMQNGFPNGEGFAIYEDKATYKGMFNKGLKHGTNGKYIQPDGTIYEGNYKNDLRSGRGKLFRTDSTVFEGLWKNGRIDGQGRILDATGNEIESGIYQE